METTPLTYAEFEKIYRATFARWMSYTPNQVGCAIYAEKMADLADAHPEWAEAVEASLAPAGPQVAKS